MPSRPRLRAGPWPDGNSRPSLRAEWLPYELGDLELDVAATGDPAHDAERVVELLVAAVSRVVEDRGDYLATVARRSRAPAQIERERRPVVRLDHALEVREVDVVPAQAWVVEAPEPAVHRALAAALGEEQPVRVRATHDVVLRIVEADSVERLQPHAPAPRRRSTYLARTSTSRLASSPGESAPSVVASSVWGTS